MTNIIIFPGKLKAEAKISFESPCQKSDGLARTKAFIGGVLSIFQVAVVLGWPIIRWFVYLDLFFVFLRMFFHTRPHAGLIFVVHCIIIIMAWFVVFYGRDALLPLKRRPTQE